MKLLIIGFEDNIKDDAIKEGVIALQDKVNVTVKANIFTESAFIPTKGKPIRKSEYMQAIEKVTEVCGKETDSVGFRSNFYSLVLKGIIERPILEVLAFGPKTVADFDFLSKINEMENITDYARVALSMIM